MFSSNGDQYLCPSNWNLWTLWNTQQGHIDAAIVTRSSNIREQFCFVSGWQNDSIQLARTATGLVAALRVGSFMFFRSLRQGR